ncbi:glycosyltransferase [Trueperella sp. LYQ143]|uniref:glycosyltransferase n=1 Tax=Trueperella sp. LYQ143 TaxID=3391059 RepID=UPI0039837F17
MSSYGLQTRILHINEVANVPSTLVAHARQSGKQWALHRIPAGRGCPVRVLGSRLVDLERFSRFAHQADLIDLHYATNGYYGWGSIPLVLHLHGSDVRKDWQRPGLRYVISRTLERADAVVCATPDLLEWVRPVRPDARWLPNPLPPQYVTAPPAPVIPRRIFLSSRWDLTKGLDVLLPLARELVERGYEVVGVDWGTHTAQARNAGVRLFPHCAPSEFAQLLASAQVVVGQVEFSLLTMTDYQALSLGRPLVAAASVEGAPIAAVDVRTAPSSVQYPHVMPGDFRLWPHTGLTARDPQQIANLVEAICAGDHVLADSPDNALLRREWVMERHGVEVALAAVERVYREVLGEK